jgi:pimeloyl-ACP methyl ester carboxylesterase
LFRSPFGVGLLRAAARVGPLALGPAFNDAYGETAPTAVLDRFVADARRAGHRRRWIEEGRRLVPDRIELPPPDCPTLLLHGTADASVPIEVARASAAERKDLHLVEVAGAGHWPFATHTKETVDALVAFFRSLDDR